MLLKCKKKKKFVFKTSLQFLELESCLQQLLNIVAVLHYIYKNKTPDKVQQNEALISIFEILKNHGKWEIFFLFLMKRY